MCNHVHILLEVPPMPAGGLTDTELLKRLRALYNEVEVGLVAKELREARKAVGQGLADESYVAAIHERFTYRMHDLGEFMKTLLARFCVRSAHAMRSGRASSGAPLLMAA